MATRAAFDPLIRSFDSPRVTSGIRPRFIPARAEIKKKVKWCKSEEGSPGTRRTKFGRVCSMIPFPARSVSQSLARTRDQTRGWGTLFKFDSWRLELESTIFGHVPVRIDDRSNGETETSEKKIFKFFPGRRHEPEVVLCGLPWFICMRRRIRHTGAASLDYN